MYTEITTREVRSGITFLSKQEHSHLTACLKYCQHRIVRHEESGINRARVPKEFVNAFLVELMR